MDVVFFKFLFVVIIHPLRTSEILLKDAAVNFEGFFVTKY